MSQSCPLALVVMSSPLLPSTPALLPSALREKKLTSAAASADSRKGSNTVSFSQQQQQQQQQQPTSRTNEPAESDTPVTTSPKKRPQHRVEEMLLKLQRQAEETMKLDQRHAASSPRTADADAEEVEEDVDFPRIPATADDLDDDIDDDDGSLTSSDDDNSSSSSASSSCDGDGDGDGDATDEEEENRLVKQLVEYAFQSRKRKSGSGSGSGSGSVPSVISTSTTDTASVTSSQSSASLLLLAGTSAAKRQRLSDGGVVVVAPPLPPVPCPKAVASDAFRTYVVVTSRRGERRQPARGLSFSLSAPNLVARAASGSKKDAGASTQPRQQAAAAPAAPASTVSPHEFLRQMHDKAGLEMKMRSARSIPDFFVKGNMDQYDMTIVQAVRSGNLELLRKLKEDDNRNLQCCNKFGESIVHTVARHGLATVLELLLELGVSVQVCCDSGRSPLSDACWTQVPPRMELVDLLLDACPDLLYVTDRRGLSPLSYVPREHWDAWCQYLEGRGLDRLRPVQLLGAP